MTFDLTSDPGSSTSESLLVSMVTTQDRGTPHLFSDRAVCVCVCVGGVVTDISVGTAPHYHLIGSYKMHSLELKLISIDHENNRLNGGGVVIVEKLFLSLHQKIVKKKVCVDILEHGTTHTHTHTRLWGMVGK